jgi:hypothetical protein
VQLAGEKGKYKPTGGQKAKNQRKSREEAHRRQWLVGEDDEQCFHTVHPILAEEKWHSDELRRQNGNEENGNLVF